MLLTIHRAAGWVTRISKDEKAANTLKEKARATKIPFSSCALPRVNIAKAPCLHVYHPVSVLPCTPVVTHVVSSCKLSYRFMLLRQQKQRPWKEIMFCNLYKPIHLWVRLQPALSFFQRVGFFFFSQNNPECKQGKASFQKPLVQFPWIKNLWWGGERKMLCSCDWIRYNLCPFRGYFPLPE